MYTFPLTKPISGPLVTTLAHSPLFDIDSFMANQTDGLYFDFTKTDRFFQENIGPTLADDVGEAIGLALSQRAWNGRTLAEVLAGQTEFVSVGSQATRGASGSYDGTWWNITANGSFPGIDQNMTTEDGATCRIEVAWQGNDEGRQIYVANGGNSVLLGTTASGSAVVYLAGGSTYEGVRLFSSSASIGDTLSLRFISIKEVPGKHGIQATGTLKPIRQTGGISTGAKFDGTDDNLATTYKALSGNEFIVAYGTMPASLSTTAIIAGAGSSGWSVLGIDSSSGGIRGGIGGTLATTGPDLRGQTVVIGITANGSTERTFAITSQVGERSTSGNDTLVNYRIGARENGSGAANFFGGTIYKLAVGRQFLDLPTFLKIRNSFLTA